MGGEVVPYCRNLVLIAKAKRLLAEAKSISLVKDIRDQAQATEHYLRQRSDSEEAMLDAAELKLRAERRLGELLPPSPPGRANKSSHHVTISRMAAHRFRRIASLPEPTFEDYLEQSRSKGEITTSGALRVAKEAQQPGKQMPTGKPHIAKDLQSLIRDGMKFGTIYADPPWAYSNQATRGATDNHYRTMSVDEIAAMPVSQVAADLCHLHLWTTKGFMFDCPRILDAWGFVYQGWFTWCKPQMGLGNCWRVSSEVLLIAIRGEPRRFDCADLMDWSVIDRDRHSAKPEQVRHMVEKASPGPFLELFARRAVQGWTVLGDQVEEDLFTQDTEV